MDTIDEITTDNLSRRNLVIIFALSLSSIFILQTTMLGHLKVYANDLFTTTLGFVGYIGLVLIVAAVCIVAHEGMHGLFFRIIGKRKVMYGVKRGKTLGLVFYATSLYTQFTRNQFRAIALAPQILTVIAVVLSLVVHLPPLASLLIIVGASMNLGGGCMDIWTAIRIGKYPKGCTYEDRMDGFRVNKAT